MLYGGVEEGANVRMCKCGHLAVAHEDDEDGCLVADCNCERFDELHSLKSLDVIARLRFPVTSRGRTDANESDYLEELTLP